MRDELKIIAGIYRIPDIRKRRHRRLFLLVLIGLFVLSADYCCEYPLNLIFANWGLSCKLVEPLFIG
jgi:hypothetical protein